MKMLYKYPQREYPYEGLVYQNQYRNKESPEFEIWDSGVFDNNEYFDIEVEYAKAGPDDILMRITAHNRVQNGSSISHYSHGLVSQHMGTYPLQSKAAKHHDGSRRP